MSINSTKETQTPEYQCGICYTELDNTNMVVTNCSHMYCNVCFFTWLGRKETCALCRRVLLSDLVLDERLERLQGVQNELVTNCRYLEDLKLNVGEIREEQKGLVNKNNELINRQIRMRHLLEQTRTLCRDMLIQSMTVKKAINLQNESLIQQKGYKKEWSEIRESNINQQPINNEYNDERKREINLDHMCEDLDHMVRSFNGEQCQISVNEDDIEETHEYVFEDEEYARRRFVRLPGRDVHQSPTFSFSNPNTQRTPIMIQPIEGAIIME